MKSGAAALTLGALGVVFGDIGTSPLYALHEVFAGAHQMVPTEARVYGVLSLIFWALTIIVTIKYVTFIMHADNEGEGGIMALISLVNRTPMATREGQVRPDGARHLRRVPVLRRRHDHSGHLRALGRRGRGHRLTRA